MRFRHRRQDQGPALLITTEAMIGELPQGAGPGGMPPGGGMDF
jgi:hypothetical protein